MTKNTIASTSSNNDSKELKRFASKLTSKAYTADQVTAVNAWVMYFEALINEKGCHCAAEQEAAPVATPAAEPVKTEKVKLTDQPFTITNAATNTRGGIDIFFSRGFAKDEKPAVEKVHAMLKTDGWHFTSGKSGAGPHWYQLASPEALSSLERIKDACSKANGNAGKKKASTRKAEAKDTK